jgi:hypothetical protein
MLFLDTSDNIDHRAIAHFNEGTKRRAYMHKCAK